MNGERLNDADTETAKAFLNLILYRYIPDRVSPFDIIASEERAFNSVIGSRIKRTGKKSSSATAPPASYMDDLAKALTNIQKPLELRAEQAGLPTPKIKIPTDPSEMLFDLKYSIGVGNSSIGHENFGSGAQSHLMIETLKIVDGDFGGSFGWKQAVIWGIEEPEISLHPLLETKMAYFLRSFTYDGSGRFQIFCTTHSNSMLEYSDSASLIVLEPDGTSKVTQYTNRRYAMRCIMDLGATHRMDPVLQYPLDAILLVEGKYDQDFLTQAFKILDPKLSDRLHVLQVPDLNPSETSGGIEKVKKYVKENTKLISERLPESPVLVLIDQDQSYAVKQEIEKSLDMIHNGKCFAWEKEHIYQHTPSGKLRNGIEAFYPERFWETIYKSGNDYLNYDSSNSAPYYSLKEQRFEDNVKQALSEIVKISIKQEDLKNLQPVLDQIVAHLRSISDNQASF